MTPEIAAAIRAGLCLQDYRIRLRLLTAGLPWSLEAYALARWGLEADRLSVVQREDTPPVFRPKYAEGGDLAHWREELESDLTNLLLSEAGDIAVGYGMTYPEDEAQGEYLFEEMRRAELTLIARRRGNPLEP